MSIQILNVVLYRHTGKKRVIDFHPGKLNVITGASSTGKTALIDIVDYCLGRREFNTRLAADVRAPIAWYGLRLQTSQGMLFVARAEPGKGERYCENIYISIGSEVEIPEFSALRKNTNIEGLRGELDRAINLTPNLHEPPPGQTRNPLTATIRQSLFFCFQQQNEIANPDFLFHKQGEISIPQQIKDVLPYFLGAVSDDYLGKLEELRRLKTHLREKERRLTEMQAIRGHGESKAHSLYREAQDVGMLPFDQSSEEWVGIVQTLRGLGASNQENFADGNWQAGSIFDELMEKKLQLQNERDAIREQLAVATSMQKDEKGFKQEAGEQAARLRSIGIIERGLENQVCPLCQSSTKGRIPSVETLKRSIDEIDRKLATGSSTTSQLSPLKNHVPTVPTRMP
ncbi:MAG: AAA family ATPase [Magnetococcales bacterium]|nr:AAA family ATPase [Magnetococcales bacterium]